MRGIFLICQDVWLVRRINKMQSQTDNVAMASAFGTIYRILNRLEKMLDLPKADAAQLTAEAFGISQNRWQAYMKMLLDAGYVDGVQVMDYIDGTTGINIAEIAITLKGLQFLAENTTFQKLVKTATSIKGILR